MKSACEVHRAEKDLAAVVVRARGMMKFIDEIYRSGR